MQTRQRIFKYIDVQVLCFFYTKFWNFGHITRLFSQLSQSCQLPKESVFCPPSKLRKCLNTHVCLTVTFCYKPTKHFWHMWHVHYWCTGMVCPGSIAIVACEQMWSTACYFASISQACSDTGYVVAPVWLQVTFKNAVVFWPFMVDLASRYRRIWYSVAGFVAVHPFVHLSAALKFFWTCVALKLVDDDDDGHQPQCTMNALAESILPESLELNQFYLCDTWAVVCCC